MAPEELVRGSRVDERTTVFTLGRLALVLLGCPRRQSPERGQFRGSDQQYAVAVTAMQPLPVDRIQTVAELVDQWSSAASTAGG
jgi:serine/threonine-protein kinase